MDHDFFKRSTSLESAIIIYSEILRQLYNPQFVTRMKCFTANFNTIREMKFCYRATNKRTRPYTYSIPKIIFRSMCKFDATISSDS